jgi:hypothetical protein
MAISCHGAWDPLKVHLMKALIPSVICLFLAKLVCDQVERGGPSVGPAVDIMVRPKNGPLRARLAME